MLLSHKIGDTAAIAMNPFRRFLFLSLGFIFLVAGTRLGAAQELDRIARKLRWCEAHKGSFDIVFIGSSRVFHGLSPRIFDDIMEKNGHHWRSFNLGMDKMGMAQSMTVAREFVATHPQRLKYIFFELEPGTTRLTGGAKRAGKTEGPIPPGNGLGPEGDGFYPMDRPMTPEVEAFYRHRLAVTKANPAPLSPNESARTELQSFVPEMARRNIQVIFLVAPSLRAAHGSGCKRSPRQSALFLRRSRALRPSL